MGVHPFGKALYTRRLRSYGTPAELVARLERGGFSWVGLDPTANRPEDVRRCLEAFESAGFSVWLYATPEDWRPGRWMQTLERFAQAARRSSAVNGILADPESGWGRGTATEARELGRELRRLAGHMSVGLTTFPLHPHARLWAEVCGDAVFGSPQLYDKGVPLRRFGEWARRWRGYGWQTLVPSLDAWDSWEGDGPARQAAYLAAQPPYRGAIFWPLPRDLDEGDPTDPSDTIGDAVMAYRVSPLSWAWLERLAMRVGFSPAVLAVSAAALAALAVVFVGVSLA